MKYKALLKLLRALVYVKRFFWLIGAGAAFILGKAGRPVWRTIAYFRYKTGYFFKSAHRTANPSEWFLKRDFLQILVFAAFIIISFPQTRVLAKKDPTLSGQKTIAYRLIGGDEDFDIQEVLAENSQIKPNSPSWRSGALAPDGGSSIPGSGNVYEPDYITIVAGGNALMKPTLMPGAAVNETRSQVVLYQVESGDSLGSIANDFSVSVATILWENNLNTRSIIRPGDVLKIPPASGVMYTIRKGDTLKKVATALSAKVEDIIAFNKLKADGSDLKIGERIMVPGGVQPTARAIATVTRTTPTARRQAAPPGSSASPSASGFVWPSGARNVTQYFSWKHHAIDIAGPWQTPTYAAKAGVVEKSQCGWNSGYGCYVIIDHGGGVKTLYGHHSQLLVSAGDQVDAGQPIALMGNTGYVRGVTGIHLHFEVIVNGVRVNPLGYVR